jgi:hypothetical protein
MKKLLIIKSLLFQTVFSQTETILLKKEKEITFFPSIAGYFNGQINYSLICDKGGIKCPHGFIIDHFNLNYGDKNIEIKGNTIPDSICIQIGSFYLGEMIFFTNITAVNNSKERIFLSPFSLTPIKNEK